MKVHHIVIEKIKNGIVQAYYVETMPSILGALIGRDIVLKSTVLYSIIYAYRCFVFGFEVRALKRKRRALNAIKEAKQTMSYSYIRSNSTIFFY